MGHVTTLLCSNEFKQVKTKWKDSRVRLKDNIASFLTSFQANKNAANKLLRYIFKNEAWFTVTFSL